MNNTGNRLDRSEMLAARLQKVRAALPGDFEAALVSLPVSRFYLLDYDSHDAGTLLLLPDSMVFLIDSRYSEDAREQVLNAEVLLESAALDQARDILAAAGAERLLVENDAPVAYVDHLREKLAGVEIVSDSTLSKALRACRAVKDAEEIRRMRAAQALTDTCFTHILPFIKEGVKEKDLALEMEFFMRRSGAQAAAFDIISVAGAKTSMPHGVPGDNTVQPGDFITLDFGARVEGYCADMTRTVALGEPGAEQRKVYGIVLEAHLRGIAAARAGAAGREVDAAARDFIAANGYGKAFGHGLGHAVGIEVHEEPRFSPKCADPVAANMLLSVEPGIYLPGRFGCRIEDVVLIGADGCEPLPASAKELIVL